MPTWPNTLPQEPNGNDGKWQETPPHILVQDDNSEGPSNARSKPGVRKLKLSYCFSAEETDIFDAWLANEVAGGALPFDFTWPLPPRAAQTVSARITAIPTYEHQGCGIHNITLEMIILP